MMKAFTLFLLLIQQTSTIFTLESTAVGHCNERERDIINRLLADDDFFGGMTETRLLGAGGFGLAVEMVKPDLINGDKYFAVKVGTDNEITDNRGNVDLQKLNIPNTQLNLTVRGIRVSDYLRSLNVPFISQTLTYRHLLFKNPGDPLDAFDGGGFLDLYDVNDSPASAKFILAMELGDQGDMRKYAKQLKEDQISDEEKEAIFLDLFYKIMIGVRRMNESGIIHGDLKEINIFLRTADTIGRNIAPIIGDWDFAIKYDSPAKTWNNPIYTKLYRPPEMQYFVVDDNTGYYLRTSPIDYTYSGSEDIYAMAITMMGFAARMGLQINEESTIGKLLLNMAYPLTFDQLVKISSVSRGGAISAQNTAVKNLGKRIGNNVERERIIALGKKICDAVKQWDNKKGPEVTFIKGKEGNFFQSILRTREPGFYFYLTERFMKKFKVKAENAADFFSDSIIRNDITRDELEEYFELREGLARNPAFPEILQNRPSHELIAQLLYELINGEKDHLELRGALDNDIRTLTELTILENQQNQVDPQKSFVYVDPSFYELKLKEIKPIIEKFNNFDHLETAYGNDFDIPSEAVQFMSVYRFGGKMTDEIKRMEGYDENNLEKSFIELDDRRKRGLREVKQKKVVRKRNQIDLI